MSSMSSMTLRMKLCFFLAPFAALYSVPLYTLIVSGEIFPAEMLAERHLDAAAGTVYGPAYTSQDAAYKLAAWKRTNPSVVALGTSRALEIERSFFAAPSAGGGEVFYNAGRLVQRYSEFRRALAHFPKETRTKKIILVLDQWSWNAAWPRAADNPLFEREIKGDRGDVLNVIQHGFATWRDLLDGKLELVKLARSDDIGVNARMRGNGFRQDGSYLYADALAAPEREPDWQFKDTFARIEAGTRHFQPGERPHEPILEDTRRLVADCRALGLDVVAYLAPLAPSVEERLRATGRHQYIARLPDALRPIFEDAGYSFYDFTSCASLGCRDDEFFDGYHPGPKTNARLMAAMADDVEWVDAIVDQTALRARIDASPAGPALSQGG
jgi:hypothetical protein